ncbi:MAG TPA: uracil-DNA glycosylase family protein [Chthonomonadaceae bacterium]|nr:uracil-DNA glycosylase family protein [Chthonomonadaceae bacterium]
MDYESGTTHAAELLWREHAPPGGYPAGVLAVPEAIVGTSFFPGGFGLWNPAARRPLPAFPFGGTMVLGHDFHSEMGYAASLARGFESPNQPTWRNLTALMDEAGIRPESCFFTNVYMGLRAGSKTTGPFPGARDREFTAHCARFLARQLAVQRPRLILTLGVVAPYVLAPLSRSLAGWTAPRGLNRLDDAGPVQRSVPFDGIAGLRSTVVALTHPCLRHASVRHRRYRGLAGAAAEAAMLVDALAGCQAIGS